MKILASRGLRAAARYSGKGLRVSRPLGVSSLNLAGSSLPTYDQRAFFSSHDDFAPKRTVVEGQDEATQMISEHVTNNHIMLYMKGE
jgi:hypothetical protein